jgi:arginyl-tRNA synthetase
MSIRRDSAEAHAQGRDCPGVIIRSLLLSNAALTQLKTELSVMLAEGIARVAPGAALPAIVLERPKQARHGDYSTNAALQLAKALKRNPRELAADLVAALPRSPLLARAEVAGAGFVNLFVSDAARQSVVARILDEGDRYGSSMHGGGEKVIVEFVSANPTGPLHVGHGRGTAVGDAIARLLAAQGFAVHREFYYNDAGAQMMNLALSVQSRIREAQGISASFPDDGYQGEYIREIARDYAAANPGDGAADDLESIRRFAVAILRREQDADLAAFGIRFDHYYLESSLYDEGLADSTVQALIAAGKTYEHEGALWLKTTDYGDDKDRVMRKSDGSYTYFVPTSPTVTKWQRGTRAITELGADHGGSLSRARRASGAGPRHPGRISRLVLHQMVLVMRGGEEVKLSKRAGSGVTLRELIDEVGRDAVRFFFLLRKSDSQLTFDIDLARSQSEENPVYYVQYAHARVCSVLDKAGIDVAAAPRALRDADLSPLQSPYEQALLNRLADFPEELEAAARELAPHLVTFYLKELAAEFHSYYNAEQFLVDDVVLRKARLALVVAVGQVIRNGLAMLGVSAPAAMRKEAPNHEDTDR